MNQLTQNERKSVETLRVHHTSTCTESDLINLSLAERTLKRRRKNTESINNYMYVRFVLPTSNVCERLFSTAGFSQSDRRGRVPPMNFEEQIFLHINSNLWNIQDVRVAVNAISE